MNHQQFHFHLYLTHIGMWCNLFASYKVPKVSRIGDNVRFYTKTIGKWDSLDCFCSPYKVSHLVQKIFPHFSFNLGTFIMSIPDHGGNFVLRLRNLRIHSSKTFMMSSKLLLKSTFFIHFFIHNLQSTNISHTHAFETAGQGVAAKDLKVI